MLVAVPAFNMRAGLLIFVFLGTDRRPCIPNPKPGALNNLSFLNAGRCIPKLLTDS